MRSYADPTSMTDQEWDAIFAMRLANRGSIISIRARRALSTDSSFFPYGAASEAAMGLTRNLGVDEGHHNIRANMVTHDFSVPAREIAKTVIFLLSDDATFITGADLMVDGGLHARYAS